ncbi:MAG: cytidylate kinase-like family protein [Nitrospinae bacterium]|nr:cytidylate kinase-like family protein [Nitrospinota bacterium]
MPTTMPESMADKIIAEKVAEWEAKRKQAKAQKDNAQIEVFPFLTVARQLGCGEETLIPQLEKTLGWHVYGRNLLDHLAQREGLSRSFIETLDEQGRNLIDDWVNFLLRSGAILQEDYVVNISRLIKVIVTQESAIILGRGANYILSDKKQGLHVRFVAPFENRIKNIAALRKIPESAAEKIIATTDKEREQFHKRYFNQDTNDCSHFDACFNTSSLSRDAICKTIAQMLEEKKNPA